MSRVLVVGLGAAGEPVARQLTRRGEEVVVIEDFPSDASRAAAKRLGVEWHESPDQPSVEGLVRACDLVVPSPMVRFSHPVITIALEAGVPVWSEFELAARWDDRPVLAAITGTNGKTTVTTLVTEMLAASGLKVVAAGNNDLPLVDALDLDVEGFVVEASSFRLQFTESFRPRVATWLNLTPDHLDWHPDMEHYGAAKFRMWAKQTSDDLAIANADDRAVMKWSARAPAQLETYGLNDGDARVVDGLLTTPEGDAIVDVAELPRQLPHDVSNALAASLTALRAGATTAACKSVLVSFEGLPHRVQLVGDSGGVRWYDDSKATTTASVLAAASGFDSIVLIAGGRAKGEDLGVLRAIGRRLRAVIAIGEAAREIEAAFADTGAPIVVATSMDDAVTRAAVFARSGDAVLLSPACASYDWYRNYGERGDDFARAVRELTGRRDPTEHAGDH